MHELSDNDRAILRMLEASFADVPRPEHFTNYEHCEECAEHDEVLRSKTPQTIARSDLGQVGWDPICFATPQGFAYYFPGLARVALEHSSNSTDDWYVTMLLTNLLPRNTTQERRQYLSLAQRAGVVAFLRHLIESRREDLKYMLQLDDAEVALGNWEQQSHAA